MNPGITPAPLCWQEGMRLMPQHFQYQSMRADRVAAALAAQANPMYWGVLQISLNLAGSMLSLNRLEALLPDGTPVSIDTSSDDGRAQSVPTLDLARQTDDNGSYLISIAIDAGNGAGASRAAGVGSVSVPDQFSGQPVPVATWRPTLTLVCGVPPGYARESLLPLARYRSTQGSFYADEHYIAPTPHIGSLPALNATVRDMAQVLRNKYREFADRFVSRRALKSELDSGPMELERLMQNQWMLALLGQFVLDVEGLHALGESHPYLLYQSLLRLSGTLSATAAEPKCPLYQAFNYRDLNDSLQSVWRDITSQLDRFLPPYDLLFFQREEQGRYSLAVRGRGVGQQFIIGIEPPKGQSSRDAAQWMSTAIIGTATQIGSIERRRTPGYAREALSDTETLRLELYHELALFQVSADASSAPGDNDTLLILDGGRDTPSDRLPRSIVLLRPRTR